jgi:hypothetical protein
MPKGQLVSQTLPDKHGSVVGQTEGALQVKLREAVPCPATNVSLPALLRGEQRQADEIIYADGLFLCQRVIRGENQSPDIALREGEEIILFPAPVLPVRPKINTNLHPLQFNHFKTCRSKKSVVNCKAYTLI